MALLDDFIRNLVTATANAALYASDHPQVVRQISLSFESISSLLAERPDIVIMLVEDRLICDGTPLSGGVSCSRLSTLMRGRGVEHLRFSQGVEKEELGHFIAWFARTGQDAPPPATPHIGFGTVDLRLSPGGTVEALRELHHRIPDLADIPAEEVARFLDIYEEVRRHRKLTLNGISEIVTGFISSFQNVSGSFIALAPLRTLDEYSFTHSTTVCVLNLAQGMSLGLSGQMLHDLGVAGMLHDIGKLFLPEEVITKNDTLTPAEWELIRQHPLKGAQYLLDTPGVPRIAVVTAFEHHMTFNCSGYPSTGVPWRQSLASHITTISDVFDALRTRRSYRDPVEQDRIITILMEMRGTGTHPFLTDNFIRLLHSLHGEEQEAAP